MMLARQTLEMLIIFRWIRGYSSGLGWMLVSALKGLCWQGFGWE